MSGRHRSEPPRDDRARAAWRRAWLAATAAGGVLVVLPGAGTLAAWTDRATVGADGFTSGRLDLSVDGGAGADTAHTRPDLALTAMVPGESSAATVSLGNAGDADLTWTATVSTGGGLGPALEVEVWVGSRATGDDTTYPRTESCRGGTRLVPGTPVRLDRGASRDVCVLARLPEGAGDDVQGRSSGSVSLRLDARQVTAP